MHNQNSQDQRKYAKLASIPKHKLNIHEIRINQLANARTINVSYEHALALRSLLKDIDSEGTSSEFRSIPENSEVETVPA